jgi:acyl carrier protein
MNVRAVRDVGRLGPSLDDVKDVLRRLIEESAGIPATHIRDDSAIDDDLAMDSMSFATLQVSVEDAFRIDCSPEEIGAAGRFDRIAALVHERAVRGGAAAPPARKRGR